MVERVEYKIAAIRISPESTKANQELEDFLNGWGSKGWEIYEYTAQPMPSGVKDKNGQMMLNLEITGVFFRRIHGEDIKLVIEKDAAKK